MDRAITTLLTIVSYVGPEGTARKLAFFILVFWTQSARPVLQTPLGWTRKDATSVTLCLLTPSALTVRPVDTSPVAHARIAWPGSTRMRKERPRARRARVGTGAVQGRLRVPSALLVSTQTMGFARLAPAVKLPRVPGLPPVLTARRENTGMVEVVRPVRFVGTSIMLLHRTALAVIVMLLATQEGLETATLLVCVVVTNVLGLLSQIPQMVARRVTLEVL